MCDYCKDKKESSTLNVYNEECKATINYSAGVVEVIDENGDCLEWEVNYCPMCGRKF